jgi:hypothetical protein
MTGIAQRDQRETVAMTRTAKRSTNIESRGRRKRSMNRAGHSSQPMIFVVLVRTIDFRAAIRADEPFDVAELIDDQSHPTDAYA